MVEQLIEQLPGFAKHLATDSKAIPSFSKHPNKNETEDGHRDLDANNNQKTYSGVTRDGKLWQKIVKWFGHKPHLVVNAAYELPVTLSGKENTTDVEL